eukprot:11178611-Lingulodinium_polyedra.AAC.1
MAWHGMAWRGVARHVMRNAQCSMLSAQCSMPCPCHVCHAMPFRPTTIVITALSSARWMP